MTRLPTALLFVVVLSAVLRADDLNPVTFRQPPQHAPLILAADGESQAAIFVGDVPRSKAFTLALKELQTAFQETTGVELAVVKELPADRPVIVLGDCDETHSAGLDGTRLPVEGFAIKTAANRLYIVGHDDTELNSTGTAWGIYEFLERFVGVRWYWPLEHGGRSIVRATTLSIGPVWIEDSPVFRKRVIWPPIGNTWSGGGTRLEPLQVALRHGDSWPTQLIVHAPRWDKYEELAAGRPECFQLRNDGSRNVAMICYGHPRTLETYLEHCDAVWTRGEKLPGDRSGIRGDAVTVSPADMDVRCYCDDCQRLWDADGGRYGTASRIMADFVQRLAVQVKHRWPDKTVVYLPYLNYTQAPQGYKFPGNVEVQLCGMPGLAQYKEPAIAAQEQANLEAWQQITGRKIQNWHYSCWPADRTKAPYQFPHVLQRYYQNNRNRLIGSFINGMGDHWPRHHVSLYCWQKVLWNPDFDVDAAIDEYCRRMYGPAAKPIRELVKLETEGWEASRWPDGVLSPKAIYETSFPESVVQRMQELLQQARRQAAGNDRVQSNLDYFEQPFADFYKEFEFVAHGKGTRPLVAQKAPENPVIDGRLDDEAWKRATAGRLVKHHQEQGEVACEFATDVKLVWTLDGVTIGFRMADPDARHVVRNIQSRDDSLMYWQDCAEFFLDVTGKNRGEWYQVIVNANGTVMDTHNDDTAWDLKEIKTAAFIGDDFWSVEVYLPLAGLPDAVPPATGAVWYGQFTRHRMKHETKANPGRENQKLNAQFGGFNSNIADFAPIQFVE